METSGEDCAQSKRPRASTSSASGAESFIKAVNIPGIEVRPTHPAMLVPPALRRPQTPRWDCVLSLPAAAVVLGVLPPTPTPEEQLTKFTEWLLQWKPSLTRRRSAPLMSTPGERIDEDAATPHADAIHFPDATWSEEPGEELEGFEEARRCLGRIDRCVRWAAPDRWIIRLVAGALHHLDLHSAGWHITGLGVVTQWLSDVTTIPALRGDVDEAVRHFPPPPGILQDVDLKASCRHGLLPYGRQLIEQERQLIGLLGTHDEDFLLGSAVWGIWRQFYLAKGTHDKFCEKTMGMSRWPNPLFPRCGGGLPMPMIFSGREFMFTGSLPDENLIFRVDALMARVRFPSDSGHCAWERFPLAFVRTMCDAGSTRGKYLEFTEKCDDLQDMESIFAKFGPLAAPGSVTARPAYQAPEGGDVRVTVVRTVGRLLKDCLGRGRDQGHVGNIVMAASGGLGKTRVVEDLRRGAVLHKHPSYAWAHGHSQAAAPDLQVVREAWDAVLKENNLEHVVVLSISTNNGTAFDPTVEHSAMRAITWRAGMDAAHQSGLPTDGEAWLEPPQLRGSQQKAFDSVGKTQLGDVVAAARRSASPDAPAKVLVVLAVDDLVTFNETESHQRHVLQGFAGLQHSHLLQGLPTVCVVTSLDIEPVADVWITYSGRLMLSVRLRPLSFEASVEMLCDMLGLVEPSLDELRVLHLAAALASGHPRILQEIARLRQNGTTGAPLTFASLVPAAAAPELDNATTTADEVTCLLDCIHNPDRQHGRLLADAQQRLINDGTMFFACVECTVWDLSGVAFCFGAILRNVWGLLCRNEEHLSARLLEGLLSVARENQEEGASAPASIAAVVLSAAKRRLRPGSYSLYIDERVWISLLDLCFSNPEQDVDATTATRALATVKMDVRLWRSFAHDACVEEADSLNDTAILQVALDMVSEKKPALKLWVPRNDQEGAVDCVLMVCYESVGTWRTCVCFAKSDQGQLTSQQSSEVGTALWARMCRFREQLDEESAEIVLTAAILFTTRLDGNAVSAQPSTDRSSRVQDEIVCVGRAACLELFKPYGVSPLLLTSAT